MSLVEMSMLYFVNIAAGIRLSAIEWTTWTVNSRRKTASMQSISILCAFVSDPLVIQHGGGGVRGVVVCLQSSGAVYPFLNWSEIVKRPTLLEIFTAYIWRPS